MKLLSRRRLLKRKCMKKIEAVLKPSMLVEVKASLAGLVIEGMTVIEVRGSGPRKGRAEIHGHGEYAADFAPRIKIETVIPAHLVDAAVQAITAAAQPTWNGDGKVFVSDIEDAVRIRTAERGVRAL